MIKRRPFVKSVQSSFSPHLNSREEGLGLIINDPNHRVRAGCNKSRHHIYAPLLSEE